MLCWEGELFFTGLTTLRVVQRSPCLPPCHQQGLEEKQPPPRSSNLFQGDLLPRECCFPKREATLLSKSRSSPLTQMILGKGGFSLIYQVWEKQVKALSRGRKQFSSCLWSFWSKSHLFLRWRIVYGWFLAVWVEVLMWCMFIFPCGWCGLGIADFTLWLLERVTPNPPLLRKFRLLCISSQWDFTGMGCPVQEVKNQRLAGIGSWFQGKIVSQHSCTPMPRFPDWKHGNNHYFL